MSFLKYGISEGAHHLSSWVNQAWWHILSFFVFFFFKKKVFLMSTLETSKIPCSFLLITQNRKKYPPEFNFGRDTYWSDCKFRLVDSLSIEPSSSGSGIWNEFIHSGFSTRTTIFDFNCTKYSFISFNNHVTMFH